jgi:nucleoside-diphosphate-sugar epimerase
MSVLRQHGHDIVCLLRPGIACPTGATSIAVDLSRSETLDRLPASDALIHLAQSPRYRDFPNQASDIFSVNTGSTARLLDLACRTDTRAFVLASTGSVYSAGHAPCREDAVVTPDGFYAASKVAAEALLPAYTPFFRTCALRLFTPYGPGQRNRLVPTLIARVRERRRVSLDGEAGGLRLSVAYVHDVALTFRAAVEHAWEGTYNVASPEPTCIANVASAIGRSLGVVPLFERTGRPEPPPIIADVSRLASLHDVAGFTSLDAGIDLTLADEGPG